MIGSLRAITVVLVCSIAVTSAYGCAGSDLSAANSEELGSFGMCEGDRTPLSGPCIRSALDSCESDSDCQVGGCGGELCYNPDQSSGITTCDCGPPKAVSCGCVTGKCTWWQ